MISDFRTRNYSHLIFAGLRRRLHSAKYAGQIMFILGAMWDASSLPMRPAR